MAKADTMMINAHTAEVGTKMATIAITAMMTFK